MPFLMPRSRRFVDTFSGVNPRWQIHTGTLAVSSGLQAATIAARGLQLLTNPGLEAPYSGGVATGWVAYTAGGAGATLSEEPVDVYAGLSAQKCITVAETPVRYNGFRQIGVALITGATYSRSFWYKSDTNFVHNISGWISVSLAAAWTQYTNNFVVTSNNGFIVASTKTSTILVDDASLKRANAVATLRNWPSPNGVFTLDMPIPAAGVVPFSAIVRYVDDLNFWEVRVTPGTAGTDLELIEVVAGVPTVRASADVDWTNGSTDQMRVVARGASIGIEAKKSGAGSWSDMCDYGSCATGLTARDHGPMLYEASVSRVSRVEFAL